LKLLWYFFTITFFTIKEKYHENNRIHRFAHVRIGLLAQCLWGGGDDVAPENPGGNAIGSVAECFKMPSAVKNYEVLVTSSDYPGVTIPMQVRLAPVTFMGQAATETKLTTNAPDGSLSTTMTGYTAIANNKSCDIAEKYPGEINSFVYPVPNCTPFNINPGDSFDFPGFTDSNGVHDMLKSHTTFVGFETITMNGKTFSNTCHFKTISDGTGDAWVASGYGSVKEVVNYAGSTMSAQFNRDR
jgi:hypothetical protein